jgi:hypothetical protein
MSVRKATGKFSGLRVERSINKTPHIKHFSFRIPDPAGGWREATPAEIKKITKEAEAYDRKLAAMQKASVAEKGFDPFESRTNTGIRGISYRIGRDTQGYDVEAFWLNLTHDGKQHSSNVRLANREWKEGWKLIVDKLCALKSLKPAVRKRILAAIPNEKNLKAQVVKEKK